MMQRYEIHLTDIGECDWFYIPAIEGDWVKYSDAHALEVLNARLVSALSDLHAMVWGECPSLLNEDSGGDAMLAIEIEDLLARKAQTEDGEAPKSP